MKTHPHVFTNTVSALIGLAVIARAEVSPCPNAVDFNDPSYGTKIRQLKKDDGHEHNLYYYREPWNADGSRLAAVQSDLEQKNWRVCLYDGDGSFIKALFPIEKYDWRLCWDRKDPNLLYTWKADKLYKFNVATGQADVLKDFAPLWLNANGPSVNQAGDRILVVTSDKMFRSYHLPDMGEERAFKLDVPAGCQVAWDKPHYTGYRNYIDTAYRSQDLSQQAIVLYDDNGTVVHKFENIGAGGHYDWSGDGKLAYFKMSLGPRNPGGPRPLEIRVVNVDGTGDRVLWSVPREKSIGIQNLHLSWPKKVNDWFIASLFPHAEFLPAAQAGQIQQPAQGRGARGGGAPPAQEPAATRPPQGRRARGGTSAQDSSPAQTPGGRRGRGAGATPDQPPALPQATQGRGGRGGAQPSAPSAPPAATGGPLDEIVMIKLDGTTKYLAHSVTWYGRNMFWAEPLGVARSDGKRICFHTRRSGTIDLCILFLDDGPKK